MHPVLTTFLKSLLAFGCYSSLLLVITDKANIKFCTKITLDLQCTCAFVGCSVFQQFVMKNGIYRTVP